MDISDSSSNSKYPPAPTTTTTMIRDQAAHKLLRPPNIESMGVIATGATTTILRKQNKPTATKSYCNNRSQPNGSHTTAQQSYARPLGTMGKNFSRQGNGTSRTHPATQGGTAVKRLGKLWVPNKDRPRLDPKQNTSGN
jgi:hypothetical protein